MSTLPSYEKLGAFYLGRYHDLAARRTLPDLLLYNSNDLVTHALCVGMTGSGKTGLCFDLIEEAAIDGIPALLIDPKGDLGNLLLAFPGLTPEEFEPWVDPDQARKQGQTTAEFAAQQADLWKRGLAKWDQDAARIARLRDAAEFAIHTPGSNAGLPISILQSFAAPPAAILEDSELLRERVTSTVGGLLALAGLNVDPSRSREAVFLGNVLQHAWQEGRDLDLATLVHEIQSPSFRRVGVMDVDTFYPAKDRFELATTFNGLLASPGFGAWLEGEPLDIQRLLYTPAGRPRIAILSIAHLNDAERMFFVTLLLNQLLGWMRTQPGTTSLRALLYMDEIFGYFPPVANPPSKLPLLTLLKQARAFGLGVVLATQNPVDLDYKGLANIGTWFIGRLQTDRDKQRVLEGLEGAASSQGSGFDRAAMEQTLAALGNRVFLLHNVHEDGAALFESRWALSYLRGPMTRQQIRQAMESRRPSGSSSTTASPTAPRRASSAPASARLPGAPAPSTAPATSATSATSATTAFPAVTGTGPGHATGRADLDGTRPSLPPAIPQLFLPTSSASGLEGPEADGTGVVYEPLLLAVALVRWTDAKRKVDHSERVSWITPIRDEAVPVEWAEAEDLDLDPDRLAKSPVRGARFGPLPAAAADPKSYPTWQKACLAALQSSRVLTLFRSPLCGETSRPGESEGEFRIRLQHAFRERRDAVLARLRAKYAPKTAALEERLRRAEQAVEREAAQATQAKIASVISIGSTLLGAFLGRKTVSATNLSRAGSALRSVGRASEQSGDVTRAGETVESLRRQIAELDAQFQTEAAAAEAGHDPAGETFERIELRPTRGGLTLQLLALSWRPKA